MDTKGLAELLLKHPVTGLDPFWVKLGIKDFQDGKPFITPTTDELWMPSWERGWKYARDLKAFTDQQKSA